MSLFFRLPLNSIADLAFPAVLRREILALKPFLPLEINKLMEIAGPRLCARSVICVSKPQIAARNVALQ